MLYMEEESASINAASDRALAEERWNYQSALPHVSLALGERDLFANSGAASDAAARKHRRIRKFFDILAQLPQKHIVHDTAVGLQLPESINENEWLYIADGTESFAAFNRFMSDIFTPFDRVSLSGLHGREDATSEAKATAQHMRGYGDHMRESTSGFYGEAASALHGASPG
jgi:hypothetical protein